VGTEFEKTLQRLARIRTSETWNLLSASSFFKHCTSSQKTWLESMFIPMELEHTNTVFGESPNEPYVYIIRNGEVDVLRKGKTIAVLKRGDIIGSLRSIYFKDPSEYRFLCRGPVSVYAMTTDDIRRFIDHNPGLLMKLVYDFQ